MRSRYRIGMLTLLAASFSILLLFYAYGRIQLVDDAYIFLRYAHNLARGDGYVYNAGAPVEGTTSVLWTLSLAAADRLGLPLERATEALSLAAELAILACLWLKLYRERFALAAATVALAAPALSQPWRLAIMMGLETGLYALLLLALLLALPWRSSQRLRTLGLGAIGALLFLTRPEAALTLALVLLWLVVFRTGRGRGARVLGLALIWVAAIAAVTTWRLLAFGEVVPNSVIAKSVPLGSLLDQAALWPRLRAGFDYLRDWAAASWPQLALALAGLLVLLRQNRALAGLLVAMIAPTAVVAVVNAGDWMPYYRLLAPLLPLAAVPGAIAVHAALGSRWLDQRRAGARAAALLGALVVGASALACVAAFARLEPRRAFDRSSGPYMPCYTAVGEALAPYLGPSALIAPESIGKIGYILPDTRVHDFFGLVDAHIAHYGQMPFPEFTFGRFDYRYTIDQRPDLFVFHSPYHFASLNAVGYAQRYQTYRLVEPRCELMVGIADGEVERLLPPLRRAFAVEPMDSQ
ncbi:MAG: hypothetical protein IPO81_03975 [Kouleothrix sp.]|nr:hypothetical protein [Kouleothrix sp.]